MNKIFQQIIFFESERLKVRIALLLDLKGPKGVLYPSNYIFLSCKLGLRLSLLSLRK